MRVRKCVVVPLGSHIHSLKVQTQTRGTMLNRNTVRPYTPYPLIRNPLIRNESLESIRKTYTNPIQPYQSLLEIRNSRSLVNIYIYIVFLLGGGGCIILCLELILETSPRQETTRIINL